MAAKARGAFPPNETTFILRQLLGPAREWWNYLNDVRQGRMPGDLPRLTPVGYVRVRGKRQPVYTPMAILNFVEAWRARFPKLERSPKPVPIFFLDDPNDHRHWRLRNLTLAN